MKKVISFSIWGNDPKYTVGAIKNAVLAKTVYPGWICRFYVGTSVPQDVIQELKSHDNTEVICMPEEGSWNSMFWRFVTIDDPEVEVALSRDADSRLTYREKVRVDEFLNSDKLFHRMIDHPFHGNIMGGMWGIKKGLIDNITALIEPWGKTDQWQTDQSFLTHIVAPLVSHTMITHDSIVLKNITVPREDYHYIGESYLADDSRRDQHYCCYLPGNSHEGF